MDLSMRCLPHFGNDGIVRLGIVQNGLFAGSPFPKGGESWPTVVPLYVVPSRRRRSRKRSPPPRVGSRPSEGCPDFVRAWSRLPAAAGLVLFGGHSPRETARPPPTPPSIARNTP